MHSTVTFRASRFAPLLPEAAQVNPGVYGAELAWWLCQELAGESFCTSYPNWEDWGWYLDYESDAGARFMLGCSSLDASGETWRIFVEPRGRGILGRGRPDLEEAADLVAALDRLLAREPSITHVAWSEA